MTSVTLGTVNLPPSNESFHFWGTLLWTFSLHLWPFLPCLCGFPQFAVPRQLHFHASHFCDFVYHLTSKHTFSNASLALEINAGHHTRLFTPQCTAGLNITFMCQSHGVAGTSISPWTHLGIRPFSGLPCLKTESSVDSTSLIFLELLLSVSWAL